MKYRVLAFIERHASRMLGKGWGASTVNLEVRALTKFVKTIDTAIDIGGNIGNYTAELLKQFPGAEVHVFEPSVTNHAKLFNRFEQNRNVFINKQALSNVNGQAELFSNTPGSILGSLTKRDLHGFEAHETVDTMKFEGYWKLKMASKPVDIIKIDVEGHELDVLEGLGQAILNTKLIQFEFGGCNVDTRTFFSDYWKFFNKHFFDIYRITPIGLQPITFYHVSNEFFSTTNYICVNTRML